MFILYRYTYANHLNKLEVYMTENIVKTRGLSKVYGYTHAVSNLNINVGRGDIYGLIGENGAGKTTLIRMICGLAAPSAGSMELFGSRDLEAQRRKVGCTIENPALYPDMTAEENLETYRILMNIPDKSIISNLLILVGLNGVDHKKAKDFSLGMKQRLMIAFAMMGDPELLVLDEPMNGLDPVGIKEVRDLILKLNRERQITVLISSHLLDELSKIASRYGVISKGKLVDEFSAKDLELRNRRGLKIIVNDVAKAENVLRQVIKVNDMNCPDDHTVFVYDHCDDAYTINRELMDNGVRVNLLSPTEQDLESYFLNMMKG